MPALGAAGVKQQVVKVPQNQLFVTFGRPQAGVTGSADLEKDLAVDEQSEKLEPRKASLPTEPFRICCGVDNIASALAIFGSHILNKARARGDSSTMSPARRRI